LAAGLAGALAGPALVGSAFAGAGPVQVFGNWARGDMGSAHNATGFQYIGCWLNSDGAGPPLLYCEANDGAGAFNFCFSQSPPLVSVAQSAQSSSELEFAWDAGHNCQWLTVSNYSQAPGRRP